MTQKDIAPADRRVPGLAEVGRRGERGNLLAVQPWLTPADYASARALYTRLSALLDVAARAGRVGPRTVAVLPEYLGTWLVASGTPAALAAPTIARASLRLIAAAPRAFARALASGHGRDRVRDALFRMRAPATARVYHTVCGSLARTYGVTLVGGSVLLPGPHVARGELHAGAGPLRNVSAVYRPTGEVYEQLAGKVYPVREEAGFVAPAPLAELPVYATPAGPLGVMVCADSWYPEVYAALRARGAELLAVPSYVSGAGSWGAPWGGYNGGRAPADVRQGDAGRITEGEAWRAYAMAARATPAGFRAGANAFLRGALWDLGAEGASLAVRAHEHAAAPERDGAALVNVWLS